MAGITLSASYKICICPFATILTFFPQKSIEMNRQPNAAGSFDPFKKAYSMTKSPTVYLSILLLFFSTFADAKPYPQSKSYSLSQLNYFGFDINWDQDSEAWYGLEYILNGTDFNYGLPLKLYQRKAEEDHYTNDSLWQTFGFLPSPSWRNTRGANLPLSYNVFSREGAEVVNVNCFTCHAGVVAGKVVAGLGNSQLDEASVKAVGSYIVDEWNGPISRTLIGMQISQAEYNQFGGYANFLAGIALKPVTATSRGENHGPWIVWRQIARMADPANGFTMYGGPEERRLLAPLNRTLPTVDPSPWWNLKYKERAFWTRDVAPKSYPTFALNLMDPHPSNTSTFRDRLRRTEVQLAFARWTREPPYPKRQKINMTTAAIGQALFHGQKDLSDGTRLACSGCHGTYGRQGQMLNFPNRDVIPAEILGTDDAYASILHHDLKPLYEHFAKSPFVPQGPNAVHYPEVIGYAPPPLKGIWASAPYFHNGSVPTVASVLNSKNRPTFWRRSIDPWAYDYQNLGLSSETVSEEELSAKKQAAEASTAIQKDLTPEALAVRRIYSTLEYGKTNTGHSFGDRMNETERAAVLEYLKLL